MRRTACTAMGGAIVGSSRAPSACCESARGPGERENRRARARNTHERSKQAVDSSSRGHGSSKPALRPPCSHKPSCLSLVADAVHVSLLLASRRVSSSITASTLTCPSVFQPESAL